MLHDKFASNVKSLYRRTPRLSQKMIFIACAGQVTEEMYFKRVIELYDSIKTRIQLLSVNADILQLPKGQLSSEDKKSLSAGESWQLVQRIDRFKNDPANRELYEFDKHGDDEFWIVVDVDKEWDDVPNHMGISRREKWDEAIRKCQEKNYYYAVSNPFFEVWLLLHHDDLNAEDKRYAVTNTHAYKPTEHFRTRLRELGFGLRGRNKKEIVRNAYTLEKVRKAIRRGELLHVDKNDLEPKYCCSMVYLLVQEIDRMSSRRVEGNEG